MKQMEKYQGCYRRGSGWIAQVDRFPEIGLCSLLTISASLSLRTARCTFGSPARGHIAALLPYKRVNMMSYCETQQSTSKPPRLLQKYLALGPEMLAWPYV